MFSRLASATTLATTLSVSALSFTWVAHGQTPPSPRASTQGDLDGDGFADLVTTADAALLAFFGGRSGVTAQPVALARFTQNARALAADAIEDLDGDGAAELVVVRLVSDAQPREATVDVRVYAGGARALGRELGRASWRAELDSFADSLTTLRAAGDVDGDGRGDVVAAGFVLFGGARGTPLRTLSVQAPSTRPSSRCAVLPIGDTDGDGRAELWMAPVRHDTPPPHYGAPALRGAQGTRNELTARGGWNVAPMPLFADLSGATKLHDLRPVDVDGDHVEELVATWFVTTLAINAHIPGSVGLAVARRVAPGRFEASGHRIATRSANVLWGVPYLRCALPAADGRSELVTAFGTALHSDLTRWSLDGSSRPITAPGTPVSSRLDCARDHDGDGRVDLVELSLLSRGGGLRARTIPW